MLNNISWASYALTLFYILLIYYSFIFLFSFRDRIITNFGRILKNRAASATHSKDGITIQQAAMDEIAAFLQQANYSSFTKNELLSALPALLNKYKALQNTSYEKSINQLIIQECSRSGVQLNEQEVDRLWMVRLKEPPGLSP